MKPSQRYRQDVAALKEFRDAFVDLVNNSKPVKDLYFPRLTSAIEAGAWDQKRQRVALASGRATDAYDRHGNQDYNVVSSWELTLDDPTDQKPRTVISAVEAAYATADMRVRQAADRERGITGLIAAILRWPADLREAVGPERVAQARAATAVGVVGQLLVAIIGGAVATVLGAGLLWVISAVLGAAFGSDDPGQPPPPATSASTPPTRATSTPSSPTTAPTRR